MPIICQQYVQFIAWPDVQSHPVPVEEQNPRNVTVPNRYTYAFYFFELIEQIVEFKGEEVNLTSAHRKESPIYFYGAEVHTFATYKNKKPKGYSKENLERARGFGRKKFIVIRTGDILPYDRRSIILEEVVD